MSRFVEWVGIVAREYSVLLGAGAVALAVALVLETQWQTKLLAVVTIVVATALPASFLTWRAEREQVEALQRRVEHVESAFPDVTTSLWTNGRMLYMRVTNVGAKAEFKAQVDAARLNKRLPVNTGYAVWDSVGTASAGCVLEKGAYQDLRLGFVANIRHMSEELDDYGTVYDLEHWHLLRYSPTRASHWVSDLVDSDGKPKHVGELEVSIVAQPGMVRGAHKAILRFDGYTVTDLNGVGSVTVQTYAVVEPGQDIDEWPDAG